MTVRITQQVLLTGYTTDPDARVTSVAVEAINRASAPNARVSAAAVEVLRRTVPSGGGAVQPTMFIVCSG